MNFKNRDELERAGYEGLRNESAKCACSLDDFGACGEGIGGCIPGYKIPCDCGDHDYHIVEGNTLEEALEMVCSINENLCPLDENGYEGQYPEWCRVVISGDEFVNCKYYGGNIECWKRYFLGRLV